MTSFLFVAGLEHVGQTQSRAGGVVERVLALDEAEVKIRLSELLERFDSRHRDISKVFEEHAERVSSWIDDGKELSDERWLLLGAAFTHEYSFEALSVCNPSLVAHPDQSEAPPGGLRIVMSVRGMGEGHRSSIGFRSGTIEASGHVSFDAPAALSARGSVTAGVFDRGVFHGRLDESGVDGESAAFVLDSLDEVFTIDELNEQLRMLSSQRDTRHDTEEVASLIRTIASCSYMVRFASETELSERVLFPAMAAESQGLEDARFVRFLSDGGPPTYLASYTAFDGTLISQQLLETSDFLEFIASPVVGPAAENKGLALFPRKIGGRYVALSRADGETNAVAFSDSLVLWNDATPLSSPAQDWQVVQLGNCGSPIETAVGWLVLTHGVGAMRTYSIGADLLDLEDPTRLIGFLAEPLLSPSKAEQDGMVPNVVYSCGGLIHDDLLVIAYGVADTSISVATFSVTEILDAMKPGPDRTHTTPIATLTS